MEYRKIEDAIVGLDLEGYPGKWKQAQRLSPDSFAGMRAKFLALGGQFTKDRKLARPSYTYSDLLDQLLTLTPEQLAQETWGWGEDRTCDRVMLRVLEEDYVNVDGEGYFGLSEQSSDVTPEELAEAPRLPAGTVLFDIDE